MNVIAKKSLGQNFLIDKKVIDVVVDTINIKDKIVLEVGPGTGNLTKALLEKKPKKLFAIEKDKNLASLLKTEFKNKISIINDDILKIYDMVSGKKLGLTCIGVLTGNTTKDDLSLAGANLVISECKDILIST